MVYDGGMSWSSVHSLVCGFFCGTLGVCFGDVMVVFVLYISQVHNPQKLKNISLKAVNFFLQQKQK